MILRTTVPGSSTTILAIVVGLGIAVPSIARAVDAGCAVQAEAEVAVGPGSRLAGDLAATAPGGTVRLSRGTVMSDGTVVLGDQVRLGPRTSIDGVRTNDLETSRSAIVRGERSPATLPLLDPACAIPPIECGTEAVSVRKSRTETLPPGRYASIDVANGATLVLGPGRYELCALSVGRRGVVETAGAATTVGIAGELRASPSSELRAPSGDLPTIDVGGRVRLSTRSEVAAHLSAPSASLDVGPGGALIGRFCAHDVHLSRHVALACADGGPPTTTTTAPTTSTAVTSTTSSSVSTSSTTSTVAITTTTTPTTSTTSTSISVLCGDGVIDPGETCDDGNTSNADTCPADCVVDACMPVVGGTLVNAVLSFDSPGVPIAGLEILIDHPEGELDYASAQPLVSGFFPPQDYGHALFVVRAGATGIPPGDVLVTRYTACMGAPAATNDDFGCEVLRAVDAATNEVEGVTCTVTLQ